MTETKWNVEFTKGIFIGLVFFGLIFLFGSEYHELGIMVGLIGAILLTITVWLTREDIK